MSKIMGIRSGARLFVSFVIVKSKDADAALDSTKTFGHVKFDPRPGSPAIGERHMPGSRQNKWMAMGCLIAMGVIAPP
jgi:hypothetical protein